MREGSYTWSIFGKMSCQERKGKLCDFCKETQVLQRPLLLLLGLDYDKLSDFNNLTRSQTPVYDREPDDFQPRAPNMTFI